MFSQRRAKLVYKCTRCFLTKKWTKSLHCFHQEEQSYNMRLLFMHQLHVCAHGPRLVVTLHRPRLVNTRQPCHHRLASPLITLPASPLSSARAEPYVGILSVLVLVGVWLSVCVCVYIYIYNHLTIMYMCVFVMISKLCTCDGTGIYQ